MRYIIFFSLLLLILPTVTLANEEQNIEQSIEQDQDIEQEIKQEIEQSTEDVNKPKETVKTDTSGRMSGLIKNNNGIKEIKPMDLDELGDKMLELGDKSYETLQKGSVPLLVWGIGISIIIMLSGIILGKAAVAAGFTGLLISLATFAIVQFAPEATGNFIQGIGSFFGK